MKTFLQTLFFFLLITQICFAQWVQIGLDDKSIKDIAVQNSNIFAVTSDSGKVFRSVDSGTNWTMVLDSTARDVAISPTGKVFMAKDTLINDAEWSLRSLYYSLDNGNTWIWSNIKEQTGIMGGSFNVIVNPAGIVFCDITDMCGSVAVGDRLVISTDDGLIWTISGSLNLGGRLFDFLIHFAITIGICDAGLYGYGSEINLSSDYGNNWFYLGEPPSVLPNILSRFSNGNIIVGGEYPRGVKLLHISVDNCSTWTQIALLKSQVGLHWSIGSSEGMLVGTEDLGVFLFSDEGDSLGSRNDGLTNLNVKTLTLDNNGNVYAGTDNGVWRIPLAEITPVEENQILIPSSFSLSQNFPNPFNPSTKIKFTVPELSNVIIKVFDVLGNEIETLLSEEKPAGKYEVEFNASTLPSGVYFYQLKAGNYIETKKMVLIK